MSTRFSPNTNEGDLNLLEAVSRYYDILTKPHLFEANKTVMDNKINELRRTEQEVATSIAMSKVTADTVIQQAHAEAANIIEDAKRQAEEHRAQADAEAKRVYDRCHATISEADARVVRLTEETQAIVSKMISDAELHCAERMSLADTRMKEAQAKMDQAQVMHAKAMKALQISELQESEVVK